jgi:hypothetical protein
MEAKTMMAPMTGNPFPQWGEPVAVFDSLPRSVQIELGRYVEHASCGKGALDFVLRMKGIGAWLGVKHYNHLHGIVNSVGFPVLKAHDGWRFSGGAQVASPLCHLIAWMRVHRPARVLSLGL